MKGAGCGAVVMTVLSPRPNNVGEGGARRCVSVPVVGGAKRARAFEMGAMASIVIRSVVQPGGAGLWI